MSRYTPGPWSVPHFAKPDVNCQCSYVLTGEMLGAIATVRCSGDGDDWQSHGDNPRFMEAVANAHLIAAAPDLVEALQAIIDRSQNGDLGTSKVIDMRNIAEAALSKALPPLPKEEGGR